MDVQVDIRELEVSQLLRDLMRVCLFFQLAQLQVHFLSIYAFVGDQL
jgi:hypothetical protein